ncbi:hypothetical protein KY290_027631 [Solanum tuberosum]|uniref:Pentatricopeptide repeat-containing protein n=1 Tax=Solanum tuberosum TaxID=4113 RepID=A0ABQ7UG42_SOLTU|nr:hypothetical protein KY290_027631 [Solanum tuberosum]
MDMAKKLFLEMNECGCPLDNYTYRCMIDGFCKVDKAEFGYKFLLENFSKEFLPSKETVGRVINCLCVKNKLLDAVGIIHRMVQKGVVPDVVYITFEADKKDVAAPKSVVEDLLKKNHITSYAYELLYDGIRDKNILKELSMKLRYYGEFKAMEGVIEEVRKSIDNRFIEGVYITAIRGYGKKGKVQHAVAEAESYLHKMVNRGFDPDAFTYNTIIGAHCKLGMIQKADKILNNVVFKGFVPDVFTFCSLIYELCQDGDFNRAKSLFNEAIGKGMESNIILYNTLIKGMCQQGLILEALKLITEMPRKSCRPNTWTYNVFINGLCKMGFVSDASNILNDVVTKGILPDIFTFNTLIDGYCKQSKLADAIEILNKWVTYINILN